MEEMDAATFNLQPIRSITDTIQRQWLRQSPSAEPMVIDPQTATTAADSLVPDDSISMVGSVAASTVTTRVTRGHAKGSAHTVTTPAEWHALTREDKLATWLAVCPNETAEVLRADRRRKGLKVVVERLDRWFERGGAGYMATHKA
ncbi:hypothetical protein [Cryphonectria parasitica bipartite mycovirus 1]|uniref:hypothetical protein n=1 Tax=Cryphonectria parasitica bipartite mycovirus 1 TaxID=1329781 RepID=UPI00032A4970|nr:hypothetical protein [Cryphonectria parasitica bipartite mycovirus 1]AGK89733.1 hypothetical protein [Cryphonectria parasitica bipartite mycovirus 1]